MSIPTAHSLIPLATAEGAFDARLVRLTRDAVAIASSLLLQVGQMRGMFDDSDGTIAEAVEDGESFLRDAEALLARGPKGAATQQCVVITAEEYHRIRAQLETAQALYSEAIEVHIWGDEGCPSPQECKFHVAKAEVIDLCRRLPATA